MYGGWLMDLYSSFQQMWMGLDGQIGEDSTNGNVQLETTGVCFPYLIGNIAMVDGKHNPTFGMSGFCDGLQGSDRKDK